MVDCRPVAGAEPPNGAPENHSNNINQAGGSGDGGSAGAAPVRASTPAGNTAVTYAPPHHIPGMGVCGGVGGMGAGGMGAGGMGAGGGGWVKAGWVGVAAGIPPMHVNPHAYKSVQANGADLPMNDIPTLRYYYNLGVECMWAAYGPPPPPPPPPPSSHPPRHYSPKDIAQEMQQMSLQERDTPHKHNKQGDNKPTNNQNKGNPQRTLLGPRFNKRGNNQEGGNQNSNHNQNKGHNNNINNKGPNNRRNVPMENRGVLPPTSTGYVSGAGEGGSPPLVPLPYIAYPPPAPPVYPIHYYPVDPDPAMMGMIPGMGYVAYEEGAEFLPYYPPVYAPPPLPHHAHTHTLPHNHTHPHHQQQPHIEHK